VDAVLSFASTRFSSCSFEVPRPPEGVPFDPTQVEVTFTPSATMIEGQIPFIGSLHDCVLDGGQGWYFDSATSPTEIEVCPETCAKFAVGVVKVAYGCHHTGGTH